MTNLDLVRMLVLALVTALAFGCASSKVTSIDRTAPDDLPRPNRVIVHDVASSADDVSIARCAAQ